MKIRSGFVSNSSSSSFVVLLPENFDIETIDFKKVVEEHVYYDTDEESVKKAMEKLLKNGKLWRYDYYEEISIIENILKPYIIASIDSGPDEGMITLADINKVKKIIGI